MKQRLCIGILDGNESWSLVLNQLGVWYEELDFQRDLLNSYSLILLNNHVDDQQRVILQEYLENGGCVLEMGNSTTFVPKTKVYSQSVTTIFNYSDHEGFSPITHLDLHRSVDLHRDSNLFDGLVHFEFFKDGFLGFFGADISSLMTDIRYKRKRFPGIDLRNPDEIVSRVSKSELLQVFNITLKELHIQRSLPYIQKWISPKEKPVFCFRIDSDYGDQSSIKNLYEALTKHEIAATWFLHVKAHESWLKEFASFENQEIAAHGYEHGTSKSASKTRKNIQQASHLLEQEQLSPEGYCAPYGIWNEALADSLSYYKFLYTSEFTAGYDGTPFRLNSVLPLQVPVHPICTGSLRRQKYSSEEMVTYFQEVLHRKLSRFEPVIFYHHPMQPGLEVMEAIFEEVNQHELTKLTFKEYARFWEARSSCTFAAYFEEETYSISEISDAKQILQVSSDHTFFSLIDSDKSTNQTVKTSKFEYTNSYLPPAEQVEQMRKNDLKLLKTSLLDWKNRNRL